MECINMFYHPLYKVWNHTVSKCTKKSDQSYYKYGARGISICNEWLESYELFYNWSIMHGWSNGLQIDRIDNNGNYEPSNCQYITNKENCAIGKRRTPSSNKTGYIGVSIESSTGMYKAQIYHDKRKITLGRSFDLDRAVYLRIQGEIKYLGSQKTNLDWKPMKSVKSPTAVKDSDSCDANKSLDGLPTDKTEAKQEPVTLV